jgi:hypothetical protein
MIDGVSTNLLSTRPDMNAVSQSSAQIMSMSQPDGSSTNSLLMNVGEHSLKCG